MRRLFALLPLLIVMLCGFLMVAEDDASRVTVADIRFGENAQGQTRMVLDLDARPDFLAGPVAGPNDERSIVLYVKGAQFPGEAGIGVKEGLGVIGSVTYGPGRARIDLRRSALATRQFILPPAGTIAHHRLVIDLDQASDEDFLAAAKAFTAPLDELTDSVRKPAAKPGVAAEPQSSPAQKPSQTLGQTLGQTLAQAPGLKPALSRTVKASKYTPPSLKPRSRQSASAASASAAPEAQEPFTMPKLPVLDPAPARYAKARPLIVLDPGHGGRDGGTTGQGGTGEKVVNLSYAKALQLILRARGYDVLLTRNDDRYLRHEDRIGMAREAGADLFMSLHADAHADKSVRGASVYTLSDKRSDRLESDIKETGDFILYDVEVHRGDNDGVADILLDLARTNARQNSDKLATALIDNMRGTMPLLKNPKRRAALLVLLSPDVPAVLVELAFLSNARDEQNLNNLAWKRSAVAAIADGVDAYFAAAGMDGRLDGGSSDRGL